MPKFFFHMRRREQLIEDHEGSDLPDLAAAEIEAVAAAREILAERIRMGEIVDGSSFEISDGGGKVLARVWFKDLIRVH